MSAVEFPANIGVIVDQRRQGLKIALEERLNKFVIDHLIPRAPSVIDAVPIEYCSGFDERYKELINMDYYPVLFLDHESHPDGPVASRIVRRLITLANEVRPLEDPLKGFKMPVAISMEDGVQGPVVEAGYKLFEDIMIENGLNTLKVARKKDQASGSESDNFALLREVVGTPAQGYGIAVFPEGVMEGGRRPLVNGERVGPRDRINGLQEPTQGFLARLYQALTHRQVYKIMYIPAGVFGGYRILDPEKRRPTWSACLAAFGLMDPAGLMLANVGMPETTEEIQEKFGASLKKETIFAVSTHLMQNLKPLIPESAWGVFR